MSGAGWPSHTLRPHVLAWACMVLLSQMALAQADRPADDAYTDRQIEDTSLVMEVQPWQSDAAVSDPNGWPRRLSTEVRLQRDANNLGTSIQSRWLTVRGLIDTPNHGTLSLDASILDAKGPSSGLFDAEQGKSRGYLSISQRRLPLGGDAYADHHLGAHLTTSLPLVSQQYRIGLPGRAILGFSGQWAAASGEWVSQMSAGDIALVDAQSQAAFRSSGSRIWQAGVQRRLGSAAEGSWTYAGQVSATEANPALQPQGNVALFQAVRFEQGPAVVQGNVLLSRENNEAATRHGAWLDGNWRSSDLPMEHRVGLNHLPQRQSWLGSAMGSGFSGGYWRSRWQSPDFSADGQVDHQRYTQNPALGSITQLFATLRKQDETGVSWGAQTMMLRTNATLNSTLLYREERWIGMEGHWKVFAGVQDLGGKRNSPVGVDAAGTLGLWRWNLSASLLTAPGAQRSGSDVSLGISGGSGPMSLNGTLRRYMPVGGGVAGQSSALSLAWRLAPGWSLAAAVARSLGSVPLASTGPSNSPPPLPGFEGARLIQNFAWITLRHDFSAGTGMAPLGGQPGAGGGSIEGIVYLDTNGDGRLDANDEPARGVTVLLDNRYSVRTDSGGRYEFPLVSTGSHKIEIVSDNLPLPWSLDKRGASTVAVNLRGRTRIDFGAVRQ